MPSSAGGRRLLWWNWDKRRKSPRGSLRILNRCWNGAESRAADAPSRRSRRWGSAMRRFERRKSEDRGGGKVPYEGCGRIDGKPFDLRGKTIADFRRKTLEGIPCIGRNFY